MNSFIFNDYINRLVKGEVNSAQTWHFFPVNRKFVAHLENCSSLDYKQLRTTGDIGCYSADGYTEHRKKYLYNEINDTYTVSPFYDVVSAMSGLVTASYSKVMYTKASDTVNKPLFIDKTITERELKTIYNIELNDEHRKFINDGFYFVTKTSELNWLADRCEKNNTFNICLGDNIEGTNLSKPIGSYEHPYQGTFNGCGYVFSSCNIEVKKDINGVIGVLGNLGKVENIRIADMSFSSNNLISTSYCTKYNNDAIAGFVAKNYGKVTNVSSIGTNYVYGLSPTYYFSENRSDKEKGSYATDYTKYRKCYIIHEKINKLNRFNRGKFILQQEGSWNTALEYQDLYIVDYTNKEEILEGVKLKDEDYLVLFTDEDNNVTLLGDFTKPSEDDNGYYYTQLDNPSGVVIKPENFGQLVSNDENGNRLLKIIKGNLFNTTTKDNISGYFKDNKCYYYCNDELLDLHYLYVNSFEYETYSDKPASVSAKYSVSAYTEKSTDSQSNRLIQLLNTKDNVYYPNENDKFIYNMKGVVDSPDIVNHYYGYYNNTDYNSVCCQGLPNQLKYTYITSPIVGANYNLVSGCLNNSTVNFGMLTKNTKPWLNPFAGEYGSIAGYNEGQILNNTSNTVLQTYNLEEEKSKVDLLNLTTNKIICYYTEDTLKKMDASLIRLMNNQFMYSKNCIIFGNIVGRNNMYNDNSNIENNISRVNDQLSGTIDVNFNRVSTLIGSMYVTNNTKPVSEYKSTVKNNASYIQVRDNSKNDTYFFNEMNLDLNQLPNTFHYSDRTSRGVYYDKTKDINKLYSEEINRIINKYDSSNTIAGKAYKNIKININEDICYIPQNFSYLKKDKNKKNYLANCSWETQNTTTTTVTVNTMKYDLSEVGDMDKGFDIAKYMINENYDTRILKPLSANVEFDFTNANFKVKDKENNLYWGTSADPKIELKNKERCEGEVINSKDFAGVIVYDDDGNLVGYDNNINTNVIYNTYSFNFKNDVAMEIDNGI